MVPRCGSKGGQGIAEHRLVVKKTTWAASPRVLMDCVLLVVFMLCLSHASSLSFCASLCCLARALPEGGQSTATCTTLPAAHLSCTQRSFHCGTCIALLSVFVYSQVTTSSPSAGAADLAYTAVRQQSVCFSFPHNLAAPHSCRLLQAWCTLRWDSSSNPRST